MVFNVHVVHAVHKDQINFVSVAVYAKVLFQRHEFVSVVVHAKVVCQRHEFFALVELILFLLLSMQRCYLSVMN